MPQIDHQVKATREGSPGDGLTATGYVIEAHVPFVALPSERAKRMPVVVTNPLNGKSVAALVMDVGPHHIDDDDYVFGNARPRAESDGSNGAGIDLGEYVWAALGMEDNTEVVWRFLE